MYQNSISIKYNLPTFPTEGYSSGNKGKTKGNNMNDLITKTIGTGTTIKNLGDQWSLKNSKHGIFFGTMEKIMDIGEQIGLDSDDLDYAICTMLKMNHNVAEFGLYGTFMYTSKEEIEKAG